MNSYLSPANTNTNTHANTKNAKRLTSDDNFDGVVNPPLSVSCDARVIREVAVPDENYSQNYKQIILERIKKNGKKL